MADIAAVRTAVDEVVTILDEVDPDTRRKIPDTTVAVWVRDLDVAFRGRLDSGHLVDVEDADPADLRQSRLRLTLTSDDLIAVVEGRLGFGAGWARGRIKVDAHLRDLFELRKFL
jgi:uncharacterized protein YehS (DUF1456 family)